MDQEIKVTYSVIAILIVLLGGIAYYLEQTVKLPQVQVTSQSEVSSEATTTDGVRKAVSKTSLPKSAITTQTTSTTTMNIPEKFSKAVITTNKGAIEITFATSTPEAVKNFVRLAASGFYDGTRFHRVIRDFMIQGGDPLSKDVANKNIWGTGGPGYTFPDEISPNDSFVQGTVAMANSGPNTNGSQFFVVTAVAGTPWLTGKHTIFAHVTSGLDTALRIQDMQTDGMDRPTQDVFIEKVEIE